MYYVDSNRTLTRRESSLIVSKKHSFVTPEIEVVSTARAPSTAHFAIESSTSLILRPSGTVRKELITAMFESMLSTIVESWEVIGSHKPEESMNMAMEKTVSELTLTTKKKKSTAKSSKTKRSRSKLELDSVQTEPSHHSWWSGSDEKAIIRFRNGNIYEGCVSMKRMQGEGRFQWADGTIYMGQFKDNEIIGKGIIQWKDDTWYEGDFVGNLRHGRGLYVDSRNQRSYMGGWYCGTKHGEGVIYYSKTFKNSYDGHWIHNVRHGYGSREYCAFSGYNGEWDKYVREGKGLMIWPNHDFYKGQWKNGVMSGYGIYIWDTWDNNSMSCPSLVTYRGLWDRSQRNGYGVLNLGLGLGSHYKGDFKNNKKFGMATLVTNNGFILQDKNLFVDDNIVAKVDENEMSGEKIYHLLKPYKFNICDNTVGFIYHIENALNNVDRKAEVRAKLLYDYFDKNKNLDGEYPEVLKKEEVSADTSSINDLIAFEERSLRKALRCYETELKVIYYKYATICNTEEIYFTPVLIRLYLWQFYYDCHVHEKDITLVEIDNIFYQNPEWLAKTPHNPFEKIYFWQFLHSLISVASRLYAKQQLPGRKPDTILASAFRCFMERDVLPSFGNYNGRLANGYGTFIPLRGTYELYRILGEPHSVRTFISAVRRSPHNIEQPQPDLIEAPNDNLPLGRNVYIFSDEMSFVTDKVILAPEDDDNTDDSNNLRLFNFGNLSTKTIITIFSNIFPQLCCNDTIINLEIQITFFEFFEVFVLCTEESIRVKELRCREKLSHTEVAPPTSPVGGKAKYNYFP